MAMNAISLSVSLTVKDLDASLAWYTNVLGFSVTQKHERGGVERAISLRAGAAQVLINQDDGAKGTDRAKGEGTPTASDSPFRPNVDYNSLVDNS